MGHPVSQKFKLALKIQKKFVSTHIFSNVFFYFLPKNSGIFEFMSWNLGLVLDRVPTEDPPNHVRYSMLLTRSKFGAKFIVRSTTYVRSRVSTLAVRLRDGAWQRATVFRASCSLIAPLPCAVTQSDRESADATTYVRRGLPEDASSCYHRARDLATCFSIDSYGTTRCRLEKQNIQTQSGATWLSTRVCAATITSKTHSNCCF